MDPLILAPVIAIVAAAVPSAASPPPVAEKARWVINYAESFCLLSRDRTSAQPGVAFRTRPFADEHEILLTLPPTDERPFNQKGKLIVGNAAAGDERWVAMVVSKKAQVKAVETSIKIDEMADAMNSGRLRILVGSRLDTTVILPNIGKASAALRTCEEDLAKRWKIVRNWTVGPKPLVDTRSVFRASDYPAKMLDAEKRGSVRALLAVDAGGSIGECRIIETSGEKLFEETVCGVYRKRARFTPARDVHSKAVGGYYLAPTVRFEMAY